MVRARFSALLLLVVGLGAQSTQAGVDAWPLFSTGPEGTTILYPFYVNEAPFLMLFPFYYRTNEGKDQHFVWPLVKISDGRVTRVAPLWFSGTEKEFTLFPLIHQDETATCWSVPPTYLRHDGSFKAVYPFWARSRDMWFAFPTLYRKHNADTDLFKIWPLFRTEGHPKRNQKELWVFPYYQNRGPDWNSRMLLPLYYGGSNPKQPERSTLWLLPYFQRRGKDCRKDQVFPLVSYNRGKTMHDKEPAGRYSDFNLLLGWLYRREARYDANENLVHRKRGFLIFSDTYDRDNGRKFELFGIPIAERV